MSRWTHKALTLLAAAPSATVGSSRRGALTCRLAVRRMVTRFCTLLATLRRGWQQTGGSSFGRLLPPPPPSSSRLPPWNRPEGPGRAESPCFGQHGRVLVPRPYSHPAVCPVVQEPSCVSLHVSHGVHPALPLPAPRRRFDAAAVAMARWPPVTGAAFLARALAASAAAGAAAAGGVQRGARRPSAQRPAPSWPPRG